MSGETSAERGRAAWDVVWLVALLCAWLGGILSLWWVDYLPTNDGPQHIFLGHVQNVYADPSLVYRRQWEPELQLAAKGFSLYYDPLERWLGWRSATRAVLSLFYSWSFFGFAWLVRALRPERRWLALLGGLVAASWPMYMGFFSYFGATGLGVCLIAFVLSRPRIDGRTALIVSGVLGVQFVHHAFAVVPTSLTLGLVALVGSPRGERVRAASLVTMAVMPVAIAAVTLLMLFRSVPGDPTGLVWVSLADRLVSSIKVLFTGSLVPRTLGAGLFTVAVVGSLARVRQLEARERAVLAACLACLVLFAALPVYVPGWMLVHVRFAPLAAALGLALLPVERLQRPRLVAATTVGLAAAVTVFACRFHARMRAECEGHLAGLSAPLRRSGMRLPVVFDDFCSQPAGSAVTDVAFSGPSRHLGALYATVQGGTIPTAFVGSPAIHPFSPRVGPDAFPFPTPDRSLVMLAPRAAELQDPLLRRRALRHAAIFGQFAEDMLVFGATDPDVETLGKMGFATAYRGGRVGIFELRPCRTILEVEDDPPSRAVVVRGGLPGVDDLTWSRDVLAVARDPDGTRKLELPQRLCGPGWIELRFQRGDELSSCREAHAGRVRYVASPGETTVVRCSAP